MQNSRVAACKTREEGGRGARYILGRRVKRLIHTSVSPGLTAQPLVLSTVAATMFVVTKERWTLHKVLGI